jgi:hypothetical protein
MVFILWVILTCLAGIMLFLSLSLFASASCRGWDLHKRVHDPLCQTAASEDHFSFLFLHPPISTLPFGDAAHRFIAGLLCGVYFFTHTIARLRQYRQARQAQQAEDDQKQLEKRYEHHFTEAQNFSTAHIEEQNTKGCLCERGEDAEQWIRDDSDLGQAYVDKFKKVLPEEGDRYWVSVLRFHEKAMLMRGETEIDANMETLSIEQFSDYCENMSHLKESLESCVLEFNALKDFVEKQVQKADNRKLTLNPTAEDGLSPDSKARRRASSGFAVSSYAKVRATLKEMLKEVKKEWASLDDCFKVFFPKEEKKQDAVETGVSQISETIKRRLEGVQGELNKMEQHRKLEADRDAAIDEINSFAKNKGELSVKEAKEFAIAHFPVVEKMEESKRHKLVVKCFVDLDPQLESDASCTWLLKLKQRYWKGFLDKLEEEQSKKDTARHRQAISSLVGAFFGSLALVITLYQMNDVPHAFVHDYFILLICGSIGGAFFGSMATPRYRRLPPYLSCVEDSWQWVGLVGFFCGGTFVATANRALLSLVK